jgi:glycine betaine/proline transport system ATP-binding protein
MPTITTLSALGNSTVERTVPRLIEPTAGSIRLSGKDITTLNKSELRSYVR